MSCYGSAYACTGSCLSTCTGYCTGSCTATCRPYCGTDCTGCGGGCSGGCTSCSGASTCSGTCTAACANNCSGGCKTACTATCTGDCNSGCSSEANATAYAALTRNEKLLNSDISNLIAVITAARTRRDKTTSISAPGVGVSATAAQMTSYNTALSDISFGADVSFIAGSSALGSSMDAIISKAKTAYETVSGKS